MSITVVANERGIEVRVYSDDYHNTYDSDYVSWENIAEYLAPHLAKEQHSNDDA